MEYAPIRRRDLTREGRSDVEIQRQCRSGDWVRIRPGAYFDRADFQVADAAERYRVQILSAAPMLATDALVSHQSAAAMYDLPLWRIALTHVHITRQRGRCGRLRARTHLYTGAYRPEEVAVIDALAVTNPTRTVIDLARTVSFESAVIAGDNALHRGLTTVASLQECLHRARRKHGRQAAAAVVQFLDGRSESVGESRSRVLMMRVGLPTPDLQRELLSADGHTLGRCDFYLEDGNVVGEFDGMQKYGRLLLAGQSAGLIIEKEKLREDAIRDTNRPVARWTWQDFGANGVIEAKLRRAIARGRQMGQPLTPTRSKREFPSSRSTIEPQQP